MHLYTGNFSRIATGCAVFTCLMHCLCAIINIVVHKSFTIMVIFMLICLKEYLIL